ncbi:MAG: TraR/DksA family transcriptional regulator [Thiobacillus sp.]|nr:TraR/DksA family transcriptional regulator [Thiobacillus sp.]
MSELTSSQLDELTALLKSHYREMQREVRAELENSGEQHRIDLLNREPGDSGDESLATALADLNASRFESHIQALADIEAALQRVKSGDYGVCTDCGSEVGYARLKAYPTAKRCIVCQEKHERLYAQGGRPKL